MRRLLTDSIGIVAAVTLVGCSGNSTPGDYTLNLIGFVPHVGKLVLLKVKDIATDGGSGNLEGLQGSTTVAPDGTAQVKAVDAFKDGRLYNIDFFVDNNDTGTCDKCGQATGDHAWRRTAYGKGPPGVFDSFVHDDTNLVDINPF
jgi:hypothetical protein